MFLSSWIGMLWNKIEIIENVNCETKKYYIPMLKRMK